MAHTMTSLRWLTSVLAGCLALGIAGCESLEGEKILSWDDPAAGIQVQVKSMLRGGSMRLHMAVTRQGKERRAVLTDSANLHLATLLRYNDWVLVLSGPYVLGGYDIASDKIVPYGSSALPFTYHTLAGYTLDQKRIAEGDDPEPFSFQQRVDRP